MFAIMQRTHALACLIALLACQAAAQEKKDAKQDTPDAAGKVTTLPEAGSSTVANQPYGGIPTLDYNYYYPNLAGGGAAIDQIPARLYLCPRPVPPYVGYTYISYAPFQPHEWLWQHRRAYYRSHPGGGATMTSIRWEHDNWSWRPWSR